MPDNAVSPVIATVLTVALTAALAGIVGAVFLGMVPSLDTAKILAVSAEEGNPSSPVVVNLIGGTGLAELTRILVYDQSGNLIAETADNAVFSPGLRLRTVPAGNPWTAGMQKISLTGEFVGGSQQWLWADYLTLPEPGTEEVTGDIVWMRFSRGTEQTIDGQYVTSRYYPPSTRYTQWTLYPVAENGEMFAAREATLTVYYIPNATTLFGVSYDARTLALNYYDTDGEPAETRQTIAPENTGKYNAFTQAAALLAPFGKIQLNLNDGAGSDIGRIIAFEGSNQTFRTYIPTT